MRKNTYLYFGLAFLLTGVLGLTVMSAISADSYFGRIGPGSPGAGRPRFSMRDMMLFMMRDYSKSRYASNGERIYLTGVDEDGRRIQSSFGNMPMMGNFGCANCHGPKGRGGLVFADGHKSANITWRELTVGEKKEGKPPFNDRLLKRAITKGVNNEGHTLSSYMPRWRMPADDLDDLIEYMKGL